MEGMFLANSSFFLCLRTFILGVYLRSDEETTSSAGEQVGGLALLVLDSVHICLGRSSKAPVPAYSGVGVTTVCENGD